MRNKKFFFIGFAVLAISISICVWNVWFRSSGNIDYGDLSTCIKKLDKELEAIKDQGAEKMQRHLKGVLDAKDTGNNRFVLALALFLIIQKGYQMTEKYPDHYIRRAKQIADKEGNFFACSLLQDYYRFINEDDRLSAKYRTRANRLRLNSQVGKECDDFILKWVDVLGLTWSVYWAQILEAIRKAIRKNNW